MESYAIHRCHNIWQNNVRPEEEFVGHALVEFFGGPSCAFIAEGDDPPDLYLTVGTARVGVEVTRLSQFTFEADGSLGNRATQDFFGIRLLNELNDKIGPSLPDDISFLIGLWVPVSNVSRFKKSLSEWITEIVSSSPKRGFEEEREIEGSKTIISVIPDRRSDKKIVGFVMNTNSSADISLNARLVLEDRIRTKNESCSALAKPVWLAVLNDYWLADAETYAVAGQQLKFSHCFERIFIVSGAGAVNELLLGYNKQLQATRE